MRLYLGTTALVCGGTKGVFALESVLDRPGIGLCSEPGALDDPVTYLLFRVRPLIWLNSMALTMHVVVDAILNRGAGSQIFLVPQLVFDR